MFGSLTKLIAGSAKGLGGPAEVSFWSVIGEFFAGLGVVIIDGIMFGIYYVMKFVLNIVDFLQFFVKKLMGLDYWGKGTASVETLDDSDVIFRFLKDENVMQVFKYMIGIFIVLLIVFTIIAIIKTEWAYASASADNNSKGSILNRALKACMLVILLPVLIIMGILASNAILTSLVNAFNINNNLTLGGQVFTASAYDANKYRLYAKNNIRLGVTSNVAVTVGGETILVPTSLTSIVPMKYKSDSMFTGFCFKYGDKEYLYYVEKNELAKHHEHYEYYLRNVLGATIITATKLNVSTAVKDENATIKVALHPLDGDHRLNIAAYNTWDYNEIFTRDNLTFDKTVDPVDYAFDSDVGNRFQTRKYQNNSSWGAHFDGGTNGLVVIPDEYYVMADVIDFMISQGVEMSYVNISNPLINWSYVGTGTYLNGKYVQGVSTGDLGCPNSFMVSYAEAGNTTYVPNLSSTSEETGAIYIMAYYNSSTSQFIPVVHNKTYVDDQGNKHTFKSSSLDSKYEGLIVARGVLDSTFKNRVGQPTLITSDYSDANGGYAGTDTPYYTQLNATELKSWASTGADVTAGLSNSFSGLVLTNGNYAGYISGQYAGGLDALNGLSSPNSITKLTHQTQLDKIAESLPTSLKISTYTSETTVETMPISGLEWSYINKPVTTIASGKGSSSNTAYIVYKANKNISVHVDNKVLSGGSGGSTFNTELTIKQVPLFCLVSISGEDVTIMFAYGQENVDAIINNTNGTYQKGDGIYGTYSSRSDTLVARILNIGSTTLALPSSAIYTESDAPLSVVAYLGNEFGFNDEMGALNGSGSALSNNASITQIDSFVDVNVTRADGGTGSGASDTIEHTYAFAKMVRKILTLEPEITGEILDGSVSVTEKGNTKSATGTFVEHAGTRNETSTYTDYFFGWQGSISSNVKINVRVRVNSMGYVSILVYDTYQLNVTDYYGSGNHALKVGGGVLNISAYDMEYVRTFSGNIHTYRYEFSANQYFYFNFRETGSSLNPLSNTDADVQILYKVKIDYFNLFAYRVGEDSKQYDPNSQSSSNEATVLSSSIYYLRKDSIEFGNAVATANDGKKIYAGTLYKEDNEESPTKKGSVIASFYLSYDAGLNPSSNANIIDAIHDISSITGVEGMYSRIPEYPSTSFAKDLFTEMKPHIQFYRHSFSKGVIRFDFSFNPLKLFGEGNLWRFKLIILKGVSEVEEKVLKFTITNGRLYLDYNFASVKHLSLNTYFMPSQINIVVLVFATILLFSVLGQAVWGLVARIYDIVLYFLVMPAVVSTTVIQSDSKIYNNWQSSLISKVMSAYGVMIGINFFFILLPAIKEASQLFTAHDLATGLSQGSWIRHLSADAINNLIYVLFLLVAFTIIKTLPGTIGNLIGLKKGDEVYGAGASIKKSVTSVIDDVGNHVSGKSLMDLKKSTEGTLKNFTPGSAIYDDWRKKHPKKSKSDMAVEAAGQEAQRGAEIARQQAADAQQRATQQMEAGNAQRRGGQQTTQQGQEGQNVTNINPQAVTEAIDNSNVVNNAVENAVEENKPANPWSGQHVPEAILGPLTQEEYVEWQEALAAQKKREGDDSPVPAIPGQVWREQMAERGLLPKEDTTRKDAQNAVQNEAQNATRDAAQNAVENAVQGDSSSSGNTNAAQAYAESAAASAAAAQAYADIASGNTAGYAQRADAEAAAQKQAEKEQKQAEKAERANETRDERKLRELKEELAEAESDTKIAPWKIEQAFDTFNKGKKDLDDQVIESATYYNSQFDKKVMELAQKEDISVANARKAVKEKLAVDHWNKTHKDNQIDPKSLANDAKLRREVNNEFKDHQSRLQATAKNELITNKIQEKINAQETKMELKARGLYQNTLQKALSSNGVLHKTTDSDRIMLAEKRNSAQQEFNKLTEARKEIVNEGKTLAAKNREIDQLIKQEEIKLQNAKDLKEKKEQDIRSGKGGANNKKIKDKAIQDIATYQNHIDALRGEKAHNEELMQQKAKDLITQDANIESAKNKIARYEQALDSGYQGLLAGMARRTANGGRYVKAGTHLAAQRMAEGLANNAEKKVEKQESKKVKSNVHSSNDQEKFTEGQIRNLDKKKGSIDASNAALANYASTHGFDMTTLKDNKNITRSQMKAVMDAHLEKELNRNAHSEASVIRAQYAEMQKEVDKLFVRKDKSIENYNQAKREFNRQNHNSFVRGDNKLGKKQVVAAQTAKSRLINEMNEKNRKGIMTPAEEKEYVRRIQSYDQAIADATERRIAYHKVRKQITDTKLGRKFVTARGVVNEKTAPARDFVKKSATAVKGWVATAKDVTNAVKTTITESADVAKKLAKYTAGQVSFYTKMAATATKNFATERALDVKDATYGRYKRAKNTNAYMASAKHAEDRQAYIAKNAGRLEKIKANEIYSAEAIRKAGQGILQQQLDKKYINRIKSDLAKSGYAGKIPDVRNREAAESYAMKISPKQKGMESALKQALSNQMNRIVDEVVKSTKRMDGPQKFKFGPGTPLNTALTRSQEFHRALKLVEARLKKELKESTKLDAAKGLADELTKVQYQIKSLKNLEERTKRQVSRLNSTMAKIQRDKKSEKYKIKGLDSSSDAKKK